MTTSAYFVPLLLLGSWRPPRLNVDRYICKYMGCQNIHSLQWRSLILHNWCNKLTGPASFDETSIFFSFWENKIRPSHASQSFSSPNAERAARDMSVSCSWLWFTVVVCTINLTHVRNRVKCGICDLKWLRLDQICQNRTLVEFRQPQIVEVTQYRLILYVCGKRSLPITHCMCDEYRSLRHFCSTTRFLAFLLKSLA